MRDTLLLTGRTLGHWRAQPYLLIMAVAFPLLMIFMMGFMFGGAIAGDVGTYLQLLMPGMLVVTAFFGISTTMQAVITDADRGVTDRIRSLPITTVSVLWGRCLADLLLIIVSLVVLTGAGLLLGWRFHTGPLEVLAAYGLCLLLAAAFICLGIGLALRGGQATVNASYTVVWPLAFLSSVFVDPVTMPGPLAAIAAWNPLSATSNAARVLTGSPVATDPHLPTQYPILFAVGWPVVLLAVAIPLAARAYRRLGA
ncbi:ABC transporter permease [Propionibacteriaceae bacterium Y2011]